MTSLNKYRNWLRNIKPVVVKKKQATQKQINALAKARAAHQANTLARWAAEAESKLPAGTDFNTENYIKKVKDIAADRNISLKEAHFKLLHSAPFMSTGDNYKYQIFTHVNWNELKTRIQEITGQEYRVVSKTGSSRYGEVRIIGLTKEQIETTFVYDSATHSLVGNFINPETGEFQQVRLTIVGGNSDTPDWIEIS